MQKLEETFQLDQRLSRVNRLKKNLRLHALILKAFFAYNTSKLIYLDSSMGKALVIHATGCDSNPRESKSTGRWEVFKLIIRSQIRKQKLGRNVPTWQEVEFGKYIEAKNSDFMLWFWNSSLHTTHQNEYRKIMKIARWVKQRSNMPKVSGSNPTAWRVHIEENFSNLSIDLE